MKHHILTYFFTLNLLTASSVLAEDSCEPPPPPSYTEHRYGVDEVVGGGHRKVGLNGRPLGNTKPQAKEETDNHTEETYVDAMTLRLVHDTTDIYVPLGAGSELALQVRRNYSADLWGSVGQTPFTQPDRPFGVSWGANSLAPHFAFSHSLQSVVSGGGGASYNPDGVRPPTIVVVDNEGVSFRFMQTFDSATEEFFFIPMPNIADREAVSTSLEYLPSGKLKLTKKHGTYLIFAEETTVAQWYNDPYEIQYPRNYTLYRRLEEVVDRYGNKLIYNYNSEGTLVPDSITSEYANGTSGPSLSISKNSKGLISEITDPRGNKIKYTYDDIEFETIDQNTGDPVTLTIGERQLGEVHSKQGSTEKLISKYSYELSSQPVDYKPLNPADGLVNYLDLAMTSLSNGAGDTHLFETQPHQQSSLPVPRSPQPYSRVIKKITLPSDQKYSEFTYISQPYDYHEFIASVPEGEDPDFSQVIKKKIAIRDAEGNVTNYEYDNAAFISALASGSGSRPDQIYTVYQTQKITHPVGGVETLHFKLDASMAISTKTDFYENTTNYTYGETWPGNSYLNNTIGAELTTRYYTDPTKETNALGEVKEFEYTSDYRLMKKITERDSQGQIYRTTEYTFDTLGNRTSEIVKDGAGTIVKQTDFAYSDTDFPGFMTQKTVKALSGAGDPTWVDDLVTEYVPDSKGQLWKEIIDPSGLGLTTLHTYDANNNKLTTTDPRGNATTFEYDQRNRLTKVTYPDTQFKTFTYDLAGNKTAETDENGNTTLYQYDALRRLIKQARDIDDDGTINTGDLVTQFAYNAVNSKTSQTDPNGNTTTFEYDALQRLTKKTDPAPLNYQTTFTYGTNSGSLVFATDSFKPVTITDPRGTVTTITYDKLYRPTDKSIEYDSLLMLTADTSMDYDASGNLIQETDPLGKIRQIDYDTLDRPIKVTHAVGTAEAAEQETLYTSTGLAYRSIDALDRETDTEYDAAARPIEVQGPEVDNGFGTLVRPTTQTEYDANGNVTATINPLGNRWDFTYDLRNRKTKEQQPAVSDQGGSNARPEIETTYDSVGNILTVTDARNNATTTEYDPANRPIKVTAPAVATLGGGSASPITETTYDPNGNVLTVKDPNGNTITNTYDELNRLKTTTDDENIAVTYEYDEVGNRTRVTDGKGNKTQFSYDGLNRNTAITYGETATGEYTVSYTYDALNKTGRTDGNLKATVYTYDNRHRLQTVTYTSGDVYHDSPRTYTYDLVGNLLSVVETGKLNKADVSYTYDPLNRVLTETSGGVTHTYKYDVAGNRLFAQYGGTSTYTLVSAYDNLNRLELLRQEITGSGSRQTDYQYDLNGNTTKRILPNNDETLKTYDPLNRVETITTKTAGTTTLSTYSHTYDLVGNVVEIDEDYAAGGLTDRIITTAYDNANRLTSETILTSGVGTVTTTYTLDDAHNRTQKTVNEGTTTTTTTYTYNALNQLLTANDSSTNRSYTYDNNGNRATRSITQSPNPTITDSYTYDYENRLVLLDHQTNTDVTKRGAYTYTYDYRTRRVERNEASAGGTSTKIIFSGGTSVQEYDLGSTTPDVEYIRGSDYGGGVGGILFTVRSGTPSYTHYNNRGDVVAKTDMSNALTYQAAYEAYGTRTSEQGSTNDRQKANTKDEDPTGLLNEGFRYRDLETDRFITRDPAGFVDGPNLYTYVVQNPWSKFDPQGLDDEDNNKPRPKPKTPEKSESVDREAAGSDLQSNDRSRDHNTPINQHEKEKSPTESARDTTTGNSDEEQSVDPSEKDSSGWFDRYHEELEIPSPDDLLDSPLDYISDSLEYLDWQIGNGIFDPAEPSEPGYYNTLPLGPSGVGKVG
ncbi:MAG: RHS repeat-associated core domain-containing protein, partial [Verrucomicrobiota bacterium]